MSNYRCKVETISFNIKFDEKINSAPFYVGYRSFRHLHGDMHTNGIQIKHCSSFLPSSERLGRRQYLLFLISAMKFCRVSAAIAEPAFFLPPGVPYVASLTNRSMPPVALGRETVCVKCARRQLALLEKRNPRDRTSSQALCVHAARHTLPLATIRGWGWSSNYPSCAIIWEILR